MPGWPCLALMLASSGSGQLKSQTPIYHQRHLPHTSGCTSQDAQALQAPVSCCHHTRVLVCCMLSKCENSMCCSPHIWTLLPQHPHMVFCASSHSPPLVACAGTCQSPGLPSTTLWHAGSNCSASSAGQVLPSHTGCDIPWCPPCCCCCQSLQQAGTVALVAGQGAATVAHNGRVAPLESG